MALPEGVALKETRIGGGFEKKSVFACIDALNTQRESLEKELQGYREKNSAQESQLIQDYKRGEEEALKKAEQAEKKALDAEQKLKSATEKVNKLAEALKSEQAGRQADIQKMKKQLAESKTNSVDNNKIKEYQQEILELKGDISSMSMENNELNAKVESLETQVTDYKTQAKDAEQALEEINQELDEKEEKISALESELTETKTKLEKLEKELEEAKNIPVQNVTADMFGGWMSNLAKNAEKEAREQVENAKKEAEDTIEKARKEAEELETEASETAEAMLTEAEERAATVNAEADKILEDARKQAEQELSDKLKNAEIREKTSRQLADDIREILLGQLSSIEENLQKMNDTVAQAVESMSDKLDETGSLIEDARTKIEESSKNIPAEPEKPVQEKKPDQKSAPAQGKKPAQKSAPAQEKKPPQKPAPEKKPAQKKAKPAVPMMSGLESIIGEIEESIAVDEKKLPESNPIQAQEVNNINNNDVFSLNEKQPESADTFQLAEEQVKPKSGFSIMPDMSSLLGAIEEEQRQISESAPVQENINNNDDVFNLEEKQPESADKFQPEEEQILDIDSFSQSGIGFNTTIRARAAGTQSKSGKKKNNDEFNFNEWADETIEERNKKKKKNKK
ncbi:MAG: hypothetical protein HDT22_09000 [Ruminococcus sp.]|nr:hypothetical protein [Ruminococcus sp.]